jgi:hypothetical protein
MRTFFLITFIFITISCKRNNVEANKNIIYIDLDDLSNESPPDLVINSIIPLETKDASLIGRIDRIEWFDGKFYILDASKSKATFAFLEDGVFIKKTKFGRGPGEMINPYDLHIDKGSKMVYVWDQSLRLMMKYNSTLEYLGQEKFEHPLNSFVILDKNRTLINTHYYEDFIYKIFGPDNTTVEQEFLPDIKYPGALILFRSISLTKRTLLVAQFHYDIYELKDDELNSVYYIDFGKYKLTKEDVEQNGVGGCMKLAREGKRVSSLNDISESKSFLSFRVYFKSEALDFAYSFKEQKPYLINEYVGKNMLPECTVRGITKDDLFYAVVEPEDLDNFQKETGKILIEGDIDLESNPYIITFKLGE